MQYRTFVIAEIPRVHCEKHGIRQVTVLWTDSEGRFTALFEDLGPKGCAKLEHVAMDTG